MAIKKQYTPALVNEDDLTQTAVTFAASATQSSEFVCGGVSPTGMIFPASWAAADISFLVRKSPNSDLVPFKNFDGSAFSITTVSAGQWIPLPPSLFNSMYYLKLVSSVSQAALIVDFALAPMYQGSHT